MGVFFLDEDKISTHTLTWSVTDFLWNADETKFHFNSHAHVERDGDTLEVWDDENISTHTLTWSVTITMRSAMNT